MQNTTFFCCFRIDKSHENCVSIPHPHNSSGMFGSSRSKGIFFALKTQMLYNLLFSVKNPNDRKEHNITKQSERSRSKQSIKKTTGERRAKKILGGTNKNGNPGSPNSSKQPASVQFAPKEGRVAGGQGRVAGGQGRIAGGQGCDYVVLSDLPSKGTGCVSGN